MLRILARIAILPALALGLLPAQMALAADADPLQRVSFYFAAHQDDWQLFMNPSAFNDVADAATKVVFIHMTAGDAGLGVGSSGRKHPFYLARDNGAEAAVRFMADADREPAAKSAGRVRYQGHDIHRVEYRNTVIYFLRIPDGSPSGGGYSHTGFQSLKRLAAGDIRTIGAVDGSTTYHGWSDLVATVRAIVDSERAGIAGVQVHVADRDGNTNPHDHSDHLMTAKAALDAVADLACVRRLHYVNYASAKLPENLSAYDRDKESSVFAVTLSGVLAFDHRVAWKHYDRSYVGRNYFRVEEGRGQCMPPSASGRLVDRR